MKTPYREYNFKRVNGRAFACTVSSFRNFIYSNLQTSVGKEMCCPKGKFGSQYFKLLTLKKKKIHGHRGPGFF
jgi:hypothetical protein